MTRPALGAGVVCGGLMSSETHPPSPVPHADQLHQKVTPLPREPVPGPALMFDQACRPQVTQPLGEHAGRHVRDPRGEFPVGQRVRPQLPEHPQCPTSAEQVEQLKYRAVIAGCLAFGFMPHLRHVSRTDRESHR